MGWDRIEKNWKLARSRAGSLWLRLTDEDLDAIHGSREQLVRRLGELYGHSTKETELQAVEVDWFASTFQEKDFLPIPRGSWT